jgi:hypothetical protein
LGTRCNSQIAIAVAVGLFGILTIFVSMDQVADTHKGKVTDWNKLELWEKGGKIFLSLPLLSFTASTPREFLGFWVDVAML